MSNLLRPNRILEKLRRGELVCSIKINLADPRVVQLVGLNGFDCAWLDAEHVPSTTRDLEDGIRAAYAHSIDPIVRVKRGSYSDMIHPLEMDAAGIMVPHVMSADDARNIARTTRFHPLGRRPVDGGNADGAFCLADFQEYMKHANTQKLVIIQIEDVEAMQELDEIAAVKGIDMLFFGPGDFSQSLGCPGRTDDSRLLDARRLVAEAAKKHGKFAGTVGGPAVMEQLAELGYQFFNVGADVIGLGQYLAGLASQVRGARKAPAASGSVYQQP
ncbi:MAG: aldolase [Phycisphaeraceae bacterium]|nr:aldolase [Phycisphaeraceae bacterium]